MFYECTCTQNQNRFSSSLSSESGTATSELSDGPRETCNGTRNTDGAARTTHSASSPIATAPAYSVWCSTSTQERVGCELQLQLQAWLERSAPPASCVPQVIDDVAILDASFVLPPFDALRMTDSDIFTSLH